MSKKNPKRGQVSALSAMPLQRGERRGKKKSQYACTGCLVGNRWAVSVVDLPLDLPYLCGRRCATDTALRLAHLFSSRPPVQAGRARGSVFLLVRQALALASGTRTAPPRLLQKKIRRRHQNPAAPCGWLPSFVSMPVSFSFSFLKNFFDLCGFHLVPPLRKLFFFLPVVYCRRACMPILLQDNLFFFFSCVHLR